VSPYLVDVRHHTTRRDGGLDEPVELLITADGQLQMARLDALHLEVAGGVSCQLQHLGTQVLEDGGTVDGRGGAHTAALLHGVLEVAVDTTDGEGQTGAERTRHRRGLATLGLTLQP
jgi:hypothetical protein